MAPYLAVIRGSCTIIIGHKISLWTSIIILLCAFCFLGVVSSQGNSLLFLLCRFFDTPCKPLYNFRNSLSLPFFSWQFGLLNLPVYLFCLFFNPFSKRSILPYANHPFVGYNIQHKV